MNLLKAWKKVLLFGLFGAVGCLAGWLVGEPYLATAGYLTKKLGAKDVPSLISQPAPSAEPPLLSDDIRERVEKAGGKSGDVQISLIWYNVNDLDLHCKDPNGEIIYYKNPRARSGGELDVDANAARDDRRSPLTREPVENIYWPKNGAPPGHYEVMVNHFAHRPEAGAPNATKYKVNVLHDGKRHEFEGTISNNGTQNNLRTIYEFELAPRLELFAPSKVTLAPGRTVMVRVEARRTYYAGPLDVKLENLPPDVTAGTLTIPEGKDTGEIELKTADFAKEVEKPIKFVLSGGKLSASADAQLAVAPQEFSLWAVLSIGVWTALLAVGLCLALLAGQNKYLGKKPFAPGRVPLAVVILGAAAAGFVSGSIGQSLYFVCLVYLGVPKLGFLVGWVLLGGLLGAGMSAFVPNLDAKKAALAGLGGGLLGAVAFWLLSYAGDWIGRFGGAALLGFCIGLMVAVVEAAFRRAWLDVRFSEREVITVNLGPEPVKVGADSRACTVWARGAAPIALRYWIRDGKVYCEDVPTKREMIATNGDTRAAGNVTVVVRTGGAPAGATPAPVPSRPVPPALPVPLPAPLAPPVPAPPAAAVPPRPAPAAPAKSAPPDYDDGLPMPLGPPPPPRPAAASILDMDDYRASAGSRAAPAPPPAPPKPAPPAPPTPAAAKPAPPVPKLPVPGAAPSVPKPTPSAPKPPATGDPDACPSCGRKAHGNPGSRYCMVCDRTF